VTVPAAVQNQSVTDPQRYDDVVRALATVRDPELDQPVTDLGFVAECSVSPEGDVRVLLRLPTYFCAPNFAYLMVADAHDALIAVPEVRRVTVELVEHFASEPINAAVAARAGFVGAFGDLAEAELDALRTDFVRKAVLAGTDRVARPLLAAVDRPQDLAELTLGDAPDTPDRERLRTRRAELGLPYTDDAPLLVDPATGRGVTRAEVTVHLGRARLTRVSVEANAGVCRGMLLARYASSGIGEREER
jgi:metal-sulfur cluster biosynthetic enzyme